jgi:hypothetical protein
VSVAWYCHSPSNHYLVTRSRAETSQLQVCAIRNSTPYKLGIVELDNIAVKDRDMSFMTVYNQTFLRVNINHVEGESTVALKEIQIYCCK